jgi:hypothetical protein
MSSIDYKQDSKSLFLAAINDANPGMGLTESMVTFGYPAASEVPGYNTVVTVYNKENAGFILNSPVYFNRQNIADVIASSNVAILPQAGATRLSDIMNLINDRFGIWLLPGDYTDATFDASDDIYFPRKVTLSIDPGNYVYYGTVELKLGGWSDNPDVGDSFYNLRIVSNLPNPGSWVSTHDANMQRVANSFGSNKTPTLVDIDRLTCAGTKIGLVGNFSYLDGTAKRNCLGVLLDGSDVYNLSDAANAIGGSGTLVDQVLVTPTKTFLCSRRVVSTETSTQGTLFINELEKSSDGSAMVPVGTGIEYGYTATVDAIPVWGGTAYDEIVGFIISDSSYVVGVGSTQKTIAVVYSLYGVDGNIKGSFQMSYLQDADSGFENRSTYIGFSEGVAAEDASGKILLDLRLCSDVPALKPYCTSLICGGVEYVQTTTSDGNTAFSDWFGLVEIDTTSAQLAAIPVVSPYGSKELLRKTDATTRPTFIYDRTQSGNVITGYGSAVNPAYCKGRLSTRPVTISNGLLKLRKSEQYALENDDCNLKDTVFVPFQSTSNGQTVTTGYGAVTASIGSRWRNNVTNGATELVLGYWNPTGYSILNRTTAEAGATPYTCVGLLMG